MGRDWLGLLPHTLTFFCIQQQNLTQQALSAISIFHFVLAFPVRSRHGHLASKKYTQRPHIEGFKSSWTDIIGITLLCQKKEVGATETLGNRKGKPLIKQNDRCKFSKNMGRGRNSSKLVHSWYSR